jgi:hypothetical protein
VAPEVVGGESALDDDADAAGDSGTAPVAGSVAAPEEVDGELAHDDGSGGAGDGGAASETGSVAAREEGGGTLPPDGSMSATDDGDASLCVGGGAAPEPVGGGYASSVVEEVVSGCAVLTSGAAPARPPRFEVVYSDVLPERFALSSGHFSAPSTYPYGFRATGDVSLVRAGKFDLDDLGLKTAHAALRGEPSAALVDVSGKGNLCSFRCISLGFFGSLDHVDAVRSSIIGGLEAALLVESGSVDPMNRYAVSGTDTRGFLRSTLKSAAVNAVDGRTELRRELDAILKGHGAGLTSFAFFATFIAGRAVNVVVHGPVTAADVVGSRTGVGAVRTFMETFHEGAPTFHFWHCGELDLARGLNHPTTHYNVIARVAPSVGGPSSALAVLPPAGAGFLDPAILQGSSALPVLPPWFHVDWTSLGKGAVLIRGEPDEPLIRITPTDLHRTVAGRVWNSWAGMAEDVDKFLFYSGWTASELLRFLDRPIEFDEDIDTREAQDACQATQPNITALNSHYVTYFHRLLNSAVSWNVSLAAPRAYDEASRLHPPAAPGSPIIIVSTQESAVEPSDEDTTDVWKSATGRRGSRDSAGGTSPSSPAHLAAQLPSAPLSASTAAASPAAAPPAASPTAPASARGRQTAAAAPSGSEQAPSGSASAVGPRTRSRSGVPAKPVAPAGAAAATTAAGARGAPKPVACGGRPPSQPGSSATARGAAAAARGGSKPAAGPQQPKQAAARSSSAAAAAQSGRGGSR